MEFKKPNRYDKGRPKIALPERDDSAPLTFRPVRQAAPTPTQPSHNSKKVPSKTLGFGVLRSQNPIIGRIRRLFSTKKVVITSIVALVAIGLFITWLSVNQQNIAKKASTRNTNESVENLEYQTVLPDTKSISDLGGWKRISPAKADPVFAYADKIGDVPISVSEQPLPVSFKTNVDDQIAELAKKFNATTKIDAAGTKVYIGTSAKGPQSVILTKNDLLILIKSEKNVAEKDWIRYVKSLN